MALSTAFPGMDCQLSVPISIFQYKIPAVHHSNRNIPVEVRIETRLRYNAVGQPQSDRRGQPMNRVEESTLWLSSRDELDVFFFTDLSPDTVLKMRHICEQIGQVPTSRSLRIESDPSGPYLHMTDGVETGFLKLFVPPPEKQCERFKQLCATEKAEKEEAVRKVADLQAQHSAAKSTIEQLERLCTAHERELNLLRRLLGHETEKSPPANQAPAVVCPVLDMEAEAQQKPSLIEKNQHNPRNHENLQELQQQSQKESAPRQTAVVTELERVAPVVQILDIVGDNKAIPRLSDLPNVLLPFTPTTPASSSSTSSVSPTGSSAVTSSGNSQEQSQKDILIGIAQQIMCTLCPENVEWPDLKHMEQHFISTHLDEKKSCRACPSERQPGNLFQHIRQHANKIYSCQYCGKRGQKHIIKAHLRTHTGEKPFSCETCGRGFADTSTLRRHRMIHTGEKKHECPICGRSIARKDNVKVHIRSHGLEMSV